MIQNDPESFYNGSLARKIARDMTKISSKVSRSIIVSVLLARISVFYIKYPPLATIAVNVRKPLSMVQSVNN